MKRRLESVASTGSSASSGFNEDKSYCDSEEEEEGKKAKPVSGTRAPRRLFSGLMGRFLPLTGSTIAVAGAAVTPLSLGRRLFVSCRAQHAGLFISEVLFQI